MALFPLIWYSYGAMATDEQRQNSGGYTFIEIAVVLVLMATIVVGILGGRGLMLQSDRQVQLKELIRLKIAVNGFIQKFDAYPGDLHNATSWFANDEYATIDGDNDGVLEQAGGSTDTSTGAWNGELAEVFKHLSMAHVEEDVKYDDSTNLGDGYPRLYLNQAVGMFIGSVRAGGEGFTCDGPAERSALKLFMTVADASEFPGDLSAADEGDYLQVADTRWLDDKLDDAAPESGKFCAKDVSPLPLPWTGCVDSGAYDPDGRGCIAVFALED